VPTAKRLIYLGGPLEQIGKLVNEQGLGSEDTLQFSRFVLVGDRDDLEATGF
jgi:hypothetical protein